MIPKGLKIPGSLYTTDFETEVYTFEPAEQSYRVDIHCEDCNANYTYHCRIIDLNGHLLTANGWTLYGMSFHQAWNENYPPVLELHYSERYGSEENIEYRMVEPFAKKRRNGEGGILERRLKETWEFFKYVSKFPNIDTFKVVHTSPLDTVDGVMRYYLECVKLKRSIPESIWNYVENTIRVKFEYYIQNTNIKVEQK